MQVPHLVTQDERVHVHPFLVRREGATEAHNQQFSCLTRGDVPGPLRPASQVRKPMNHCVVFGEPIPDGIVPASVWAYCSRKGAPIGYGERHCGTFGRLLAQWWMPRWMLAPVVAQSPTSTPP